MRAEIISAGAGKAASRRVVLLPGAFQTPDDLRTAGFLSSVRDRGLDMDLVLVELEPAHLTDRSALRSLHTEVVLPAKSLGGVAVWFAGISLGAFMALLYAADYPSELDGICLLSPYLGNRMIGDEIQRFKSLALWSAATGDLQDELAEERTVWRYIADHLPYPVRYLGFGRDDRYAAIQQLLASQLAPEAVDVIDGRHDWSAMRELWDRFLQRLVAAAPERA